MANVLMIGAGKAGGGGVPTFIARQIAALKETGITIRLLEEAGPVSYLRKWLLKRSGGRCLPARLRAMAAGADLLHYQWPGHLISYHGLARRYRKPSVLSLRGRQVNVVPYMPGQGAYARRLSALMPTCRGYHCVSQAMVESGREFGLDPERAWVIRPAVDPRVFTRVAEPAESPFVVTMVGALIWRKGYEYALLTLQAMVHAGVNVVLRIVGEGEDRERLCHAAADLGITDRVELMGNLTPDRVKEVLGTSHAFLHASLSEGIANAVLEAMSCGLPVVATNCGGMGEVIEDGKDGYLVPMRDWWAMADRLKRLWSRPQERRDLGEAARRKIVREFDVRDQAQRFVQLYRHLLSSP